MVLPFAFVLLLQLLQQASSSGFTVQEVLADGPSVNQSASCSYSAPAQLLPTCKRSTLPNHFPTHSCCVTQNAVEVVFPPNSGGKLDIVSVCVPVVQCV